MFRIKICGITNSADAIAAVDAGADAIGLNFYSGSKRCVGFAEAKQIASTLSDRCLKVGVFVNQTAEQLNDIAETVGLDVAQLHGDQPPAYLLDVESHYPIVKVYRVGGAGFVRMKADLVMCEKFGRVPEAVLVDADAPGEFGGTGKRLDWTSLADRAELLNFDRAVPFRLLLAGGLTPENVAEAIRTVRPYGVDVASGVESAAGKKDPEKVKAFVAEARRGFAEIGRE